MANHPLLEKNNHLLLKKILKKNYGNSIIDFDNNKINIENVKSGRLSFVYRIRQNKNFVFVKIVKPGLVKDNLPLSVIATEEARKKNMPCPKTFAGKDGKLYQHVPSDVSDLGGQVMTMVEGVTINEIPEELINDTKLFETLGRYNAEFIRTLSHIKEEDHKDITTEDPFGFKAIRELFSLDFGIGQELTYLKNPDDAKKIKNHVVNLAKNNLSKSDVISLAFGGGLIRGDLIKVLREFNALEERLSKFNLPDTLINNEVKPANVGALRDKKTGAWKVTNSFDYDQVGFGPAVKDLGRTISFFAFDKNTGEFFPENALATIKGFMEKRPLSNEEKKALPDYIIMGALISYPVRASYLAEELQGKKTVIELDRLDPSIHLKQIYSFKNWLKEHNLDYEIKNISDRSRI